LDLKDRNQLVILFFDGQCVLCNNTVKWILSNEKDHDILFCPLNSIFAMQFIPDSLKNIDSVILYKNNKFYIYFDVVLSIVPHLKWYWKILYVLYLVPTFLRNKIYKWIARNRKKWFGQTDSCFLMNSQWKDRMVE